jgi:hypothetical protein
MSEPGAAFTLLLDVLLIVVTMSALTWRESRWSRRIDGRQRERAIADRVPRVSHRISRVSHR